VTGRGPIWGSSVISSKLFGSVFHVIFQFSPYYHRFLASVLNLSLFLVAMEISWVATNISMSTTNIFDKNNMGVPSFVTGEA
jgi:energy-converting hydrogenase Eha subunit F